MASIYLQTNAFPGESSDGKFKNSIELISFEQSIKQNKSANHGTSGGSTAARAEFSDIAITKTLDISSTKFQQAAASGQTIPEMTISFVRADSTSTGSTTPITYQTIKIGNVLVASITTRLQQEGQLPIDYITLRFTKYQANYIQQGLAGGQSGNSQMAWSLAQNTASYV